MWDTHVAIREATAHIKPNESRMANIEDSKEVWMDITLKELSLSGQADGSAPVPGSSSSVELRDSRLVCVEYPAVVSSLDRMLETLGGERTVTKTFANPNKRLELRYRPQDPFCHPLCGNRYPTSNILLRVRRRVRKKDPKDAKIHMEILGVIGTTYKFQGMADFQCLATHSEGGKETSLYDKIILRKTENQDFFMRPITYFLPPPIFSRLDTPTDYYYRPDVHHRSDLEPIAKKSFIGLNRARRPHNAIFVSFSDPKVPDEALEAAKLNWKRVCVKDSDKHAEEQMKKMFESRPIWSRNAVKANLNIHPDKLKLLLPVCAYYMVTGPWRSLWVKLGYDPRKTTDSKKYQMLDFRIRCSTKHGYSLSDMPVKAKRSSLNYSLPTSFNKAFPQAASVTEIPQDGPSTSRDPVPVSYQLKDSSYIFREGMLPPHRQMFYQLCDLDVESIKQVFEKKGEEQVCDERDGWCVIGTTDKLRDMISAMIKKIIKAQKPALPELPKRQRRRSLIPKYTDRDEDGEEESQYEETKDNEEEDDDDFQPSEGSENEMETEILDYM